MIENIMTVGIITYHEAYSYGANLQCLALQMFLEEKGYKVCIIDYSTKAYLELRAKKKWKSLYRRGVKFVEHPIRFLKIKNNALKIKKIKLGYEKQLETRNKKFIEFRKKNYHLSKKRYETYSSLKEHCPQYDVFICGSDQIWNPSFCDMDDNYFLAFAPIEKRIAYAPSFGIKSLPKSIQKEYAKRLNGINYLSVREEEGAKIINQLTGKNVPVVVDPTFLVGQDQWLEIARESTVEITQPYILTYFIGIDKYSQKFIEDVKMKFSAYKVIDLVFDQTHYGPSDFIKLIYGAKFVFTNSFHGTAFCINFNIPFAVGRTLKDYGNESAFARLENLLNCLNLQDRIYEKGSGLDESWFQLDFANVNKKRKELVKKSENFLLTTLEMLNMDYKNRE